MGNLTYDKVYDELRESVAEGMSYANSNALKFVRNYQFVMMGMQWMQGVMADRTLKGKATLTFNMLKPAIMQIIGEYRRAIPGVVVSPNDEIYEEKAEIFEGMLRQIFYDSQDYIVFPDLLKNTTVGGFGVIEVFREYEHPLSLNQRLRFHNVPDPYSCAFDPGAREADKSDGEFCARVYLLSKKRYKQLYPDADTEQGFPMFSANVAAYYPYKKDEIGICKVFTKEYYKATLLQLSTGRTVEKKRLETAIHEELQKQYIQLQRGEIPEITVPTVTEEHVTHSAYKIMERHLNGSEILEEKEWPGRYLPLIYADGDSTYIDGMQYTCGYTDGAFDQQLLLNYVRSEIATYVQNAERARMMAVPAQVSGHEAAWNGTDRTKSYLPYNPVMGAEPPRQLDVQPFPPALTELDRNIVQNINDILGRHDPADGKPSNIIAGVAMRTAITQSNNVSNVYVDNINRSVASLARCLTSAIPAVYDTTRNVTLRDRDNKASVIKLNEPAVGMTYLNSTDIDDLGLRTEAGGNFAAQKAAEREQIQQMLSIDPSFIPVTRDLYYATTDLPNKSKWVERAESMLPPDIKAEVTGEQQPEPQVPPDVQIAQATLEVEKVRLQNEQLKARLDYAANQQKMTMAQIDAELKLYEMQLKEEQMMREQQNAELERQGETVKTHAEIAKAEMSLQASALAHHAKTMDYTEHSQTIRKLMQENINLQKQVKEIIDAPPQAERENKSGEYATEPKRIEKPMGKYAAPKRIVKKRGKNYDR